MKIRSGFVSNSSTTSFIILTVHVKLEDIQNFVKQLSSYYIHSKIGISDLNSEETKQVIIKALKDHDICDYNQELDDIKFVKSESVDSSTFSVDISQSDCMVIPDLCTPKYIETIEGYC